MTLDGRVWQFLFGFLAHFAYKAKLFDWNNSNNGKCMKTLICIKNAIPTFLLILLLSIELVEYQIQRLLVVTLTALIISIHNSHQNWFLSSDLLANLGDVSYSVYLVHWPVFTMHRYLGPDLYANDRDAGHIGLLLFCIRYIEPCLVGSYLIGLSIILGYLIEKLFKRLLVYVKNWRSLIQLLFVLYLSAAIALFYLNRDSMTLIEVSFFLN